MSVRNRQGLATKVPASNRQCLGFPGITLTTGRDSDTSQDHQKPSLGSQDQLHHFTLPAPANMSLDSEGLLVSMLDALTWKFFLPNKHTLPEQPATFVPTFLYVLSKKLYIQSHNEKCVCLFACHSWNRCKWMQMIKITCTWSHQQ